MEKIREAWLVYLGKVAEGDKFYAEGFRLYADEGNKLYAEGSKIYAEGYRAYAEGDKLRAEGRIAFLQVVIDTLGGKTKIGWSCDYKRVVINEIIYTDNLEDVWAKD